MGALVSRIGADVGGAHFRFLPLFHYSSAILGLNWGFWAIFA
jgi:hypothetical protein